MFLCRYLFKYSVLSQLRSDNCGLQRRYWIGRLFSGLLAHYIYYKRMDSQTSKVGPVGQCGGNLSVVPNYIDHAFLDEVHLGSGGRLVYDDVTRLENLVL